MKTSGEGRIVNISDWLPASGRPRYKGFIPYYVSKAAVVALTQSFALELAPEICMMRSRLALSWHEKAKLSALAARPVEVYCACPPELAVRRYNARVTHPVHVVTTLELNDMAEYDRPVGIGGLVTVDTTVPIHVPAVAAAVGARLGRRMWPRPACPARAPVTSSAYTGDPLESVFSD